MDVFLPPQSITYQLTRSSIDRSEAGHVRAAVARGPQCTRSCQLRVRGRKGDGSAGRRASTSGMQKATASVQQRRLQSQIAGRGADSVRAV
jgi:hypothetical protein